MSPEALWQVCSEVVPGCSYSKPVDLGGVELVVRLEKGPCLPGL